MKPVSTIIAAAVVPLAALGATAAQAAGTEVLNEGFANVSGLSGWAQVNNSVPPGGAWFQGNAGLFPAQAGADDAYIAANFLSAGGSGGGTVDNWLITPTLDLSGTTVLSFFTRHDATPGFSDFLEVRFSSGAGTDTSSFTTLLATVGGSTDYPTAWQEFSATVTASGTGRFAFRYFGPADTVNYVGLDTVSVVTAVPEPSTWAMLVLGLGLSTLGGLLRRKPQS